MAGLEMIVGAAAETMMRQAAAVWTAISLGAALLLMTAWALAGLVKQRG